MEDNRGKLLPELDQGMEDNRRKIIRELDKGMEDNCGNGNYKSC